MSGTTAPHAFAVTLGRQEPPWRWSTLPTSDATTGRGIQTANEICRVLECWCVLASVFKSGSGYDSIAGGLLEDMKEAEVYFAKIKLMIALANPVLGWQVEGYE